MFKTLFSIILFVLVVFLVYLFVANNWIKVVAQKVSQFVPGLETGIKLTIATWIAVAIGALIVAYVFEILTGSRILVALVYIGVGLLVLYIIIGFALYLLGTCPGSVAPPGPIGSLVPKMPIGSSWVNFFCSITNGLL